MLYTRKTSLEYTLVEPFNECTKYDSSGSRLTMMQRTSRHKPSFQPVSLGAFGLRGREKAVVEA